MKPTILATGGAGYIGSHVVVELIRAGYRVVILDNFENAEPSVLDRILELTGVRVACVEADVANGGTVARTIKRYGARAVIHLAGKKAVGESVASPLLYFKANLGGMLGLLDGMEQAECSRLVFSSSATVYGRPKRLPINETARTQVTSPYGRTKLICEEIIADVAQAQKDFAAISLRYFNPVGADPSGLIGESPRGAPNNLFPYVAQTAAGLREAVQVFGDDYETRDGSGLRDYIHVTDLARGHVAAIGHLLRRNVHRAAHMVLNLGRGQGYTVFEVLNAFSEACGSDIPYRVVGRRPGDVAASVANPSLARDLLGWSARQDITRMCADHWNFQTGQVARTLQRDVVPRSSQDAQTDAHAAKP